MGRASNERSGNSGRKTRFRLEECAASCLVFGDARAVDDGMNDQTLDAAGRRDAACVGR